MARGHRKNRCQVVAAQRKRHFGTDYDPDTQVLVTVGATEAIASAVLGLVEPGSEVLLIEPFFDSYSPVIAMAGCHRRAVPLVQDGRGFRIDVDGLRKAITPKKPRRCWLSTRRRTRRFWGRLRRSIYRGFFTCAGWLPRRKVSATQRAAITSSS